MIELGLWWADLRAESTAFNLIWFENIRSAYIILGEEKLTMIQKLPRLYLETHINFQYTQIHSFYLFEYRNSEGKGGYWQYPNMIVQLEDGIDVLHVINGCKHTSIFLFDRSFGHKRMNKYGLNSNRTSVGIGGKVPIFLDITIIAKRWLPWWVLYSDHHNKQLDVEDFQ